MLPAALLTLLSQAPALRALARYVPQPEVFIPAFLVGALGVAWLILNPSKILQRFLNSPWPSALAVIALSLGVAVVYPLADALKATMGGSDADDAMQLGGLALWHLQNPYAVTTYFGNPLSPGPGWMALASPLSLLGLQPLMTPLALAFAIGALRKAGHGWGLISAFTLLYLSSLGVWELAIVGNDLPSWGLMVLGTIALLGMPRLPNKAVYGLALLVGTLATARAPFFYVPLLIGFSLFAVWPKRGLTVAGVGMLTLAAWHGAFYLINAGHYQPLHLVGRGEALLSGANLIAALGVLGVTGLSMLYHWRWWPPQTQVALGLGVPFAVLSAAELALVGSFAKWEGATFLLPALPIALFAVLKACPPRMQSTLTPKGKTR